MKYNLNDKVKTQNMDGIYNNVSGKIVEAFPAGSMDVEPVYTIQYDTLAGRGMFKESDLAYQK